MTFQGEGKKADESKCALKDSQTAAEKLEVISKGALEQNRQISETSFPSKPFLYMIHSLAQLSFPSLEGKKTFFSYRHNIRHQLGRISSFFGDTLFI